VILINGAPAARCRETQAMVHHLVAHYYLQLEIFAKITADAVMLTDPFTAPDEIDRVLRSCLTQKLPVYIELPADIVRAPCKAPNGVLASTTALSNPESLAEAVKEAALLLQNAKDPVILAGIELLRFNLGTETLRLIESSEVPFATMLGSKSVLPELHPQFTGIYQGAWSKKHVREQVEESDCVLSLGTWMTDLDTGLFSINLDKRRMVEVGQGKVRIGGHFYPQVELSDFIRELTTTVQPRSYLTSHPAQSYQPKQLFIPKPDCELTATRFYECLNFNLNDQMVLLSEPGDAFCATPEFHIEEAENFIVQSYYCSIGFCTPAALGVSLARPGKRAIILTGDGALQMTVQEISTLIREKCPAIVLVINNDGYLIERKLHQDGVYNDLQMWNYAGLPAVFGGSSFATGLRVTTETELSNAFHQALADPGRLFLIEAFLPKRDCSHGLDRLGETFRAPKST
jgi:indolepyruvate decarboxylase